MKYFTEERKQKIRDWTRKNFVEGEIFTPKLNYITLALAVPAIVPPTTKFRVFTFIMLSANAIAWGVLDSKDPGVYARTVRDFNNRGYLPERDDPKRLPKKLEGVDKNEPKSDKME